MPQELPLWTGDDLLPEMNDLEPVQPIGPRPTNTTNLGMSFMSGMGGTLWDMAKAPFTLAGALPQLTGEGPATGVLPPGGPVDPGVVNLISNLASMWGQSTMEGVKSNVQQMVENPDPRQAIGNIFELLATPVGAGNVVNALREGIPRAAAAGDWETVMRLLGSAGTEAATMAPTGGLGGKTAARVAESAKAGPLDEALQIMAKDLPTSGVPRPSKPLLGGRRSPAAPVSTFEDTVRRVPLTAGEQARNAKVQFMERILEGSLPGRTVFERFRGRQQAAIKDAGEKLADTIVKANPGSQYEVGARLLDDLDTARKLMDDRTNELYDAWRTAHGRIKVDLRNSPLQRAGQRIQARLKRLEPFMSPDDTARIKGAFESFAKAGTSERNAAGQFVSGTRHYKLTLDELHEIRGIIGAAIGRAQKAGVTSFSGGREKTIYGALDDVMMAAMGGEKSAGWQMYRNAATNKRQTVDLFENTVIKRIVDQSPDKVYAILPTLSVEGIQNVRRLVTPKTWQHTQRQLLSDILQAARQEVPGGQPTWLTRMGLTDEVGSAGSAATDFLSPKRLGAQLQKMGNPKLEAMFEPTTLRGLTTMVKVAQMARVNSTGGFVSMLLNGGILLPLAGVVGGSRALGQVMNAAQLALGTNVMARMLTTSRGQQVIERLGRAMSQGSARTIGSNVYRTATLNFQQVFNEELARERSDPTFDVDPAAFEYWDDLLDANQQAQAQ